MVDTPGLTVNVEIPVTDTLYENPLGESGPFPSIPAPKLGKIAVYMPLPELQDKTIFFKTT